MSSINPLAMPDERERFEGMREFLSDWAARSFVSMSGEKVRKFEGHLLDDLTSAVDRVIEVPPSVIVEMEVPDGN